mgnify:CR=1 FL=1
MPGRTAIQAVAGLIAITLVLFLALVVVRSDAPQSNAPNRRASPSPSARTTSTPTVSATPTTVPTAAATAGATSAAGSLPRPCQEMSFQAGDQPITPSRRLGQHVQVALQAVRPGSGGGNRWLVRFFVPGSAPAAAVVPLSASVTGPSGPLTMGRYQAGPPNAGMSDVTKPVSVPPCSTTAPPGTTGTVVVSAYVAFRALSPYSFAQTNWLDVSINGSFRAALEQQARAVAGESLPPPSYQWLLSTPVWSPLENLTLWQLGLPLGLAAGAGLAVLGVAVARGVRATTRGGRDPDTVVAAVAPLMLLAFVGVVFAYFGTRFVHSGRYLLPLVPLLAVAAAAGLAALATRRPRAAAALALGIAAASALYATAFVGIYTRPNTRVAATEWIHANVPGGSAVANEHWDDPLPIGAIWLEPNDRPEPRTYRGVEVPVFDADDETKLRKLYDALAAADFYVVSSPRAWKTVGRLPERFPLTTRYYEELLSGRLGFALAAEFSSPPRLLGLTLDDQRAEEAFWVYDHPPVLILRRSGQLDWKTFAARLCPRPAKPHCGPAAIG